jgi:hypothetical protein
MANSDEKQTFLSVADWPPIANVAMFSYIFICDVVCCDVMCRDVP